MSKPYPIRCRFRNEGDGPVRVDVYDDVGYGGWFSEGLTAKSFAAQMAGITGDVEVHINSAGGDVFDGIAIFNAIRAHRGGSTGVVDGLAASIASVIFQGCRNRLVQDGAMVMIHDAFSYCIGNADDMVKEAEILNGVSDNIAGLYASRSGKDREFWRGEMRAERWYDAQQAVDAGLADGIARNGQAALPEGLDLEAFSNIPGRIAARLRSMPVARHGPRPGNASHPHDGEHSHSHSAYGHSTADDDGMHTHQHAHAGDGDHHHGHPAPASDAAPAAAAEQSCEALGHQCCRDAATARALLESLVRSEVDARISAADGMHNGHKRVDPDGDGDCDACAEGDTDHDYWSEDGEQIRPLPDPDGDETGITTDAMGHRIRGAAADESDWDGDAAMSAAVNSDDPAAALNAICAGKREGDPKLRESHALPHHKHSGDPPNRHGVDNAMSRLSQTQGLTNRDAAEAHLKAHQAAMGGDADDRADFDVASIDLDELRAALKGATA